METYSSINAYGYHSPYQYDPPSLHWCSRWSYSMPHTQINTMSDQLLAIQENLTRVLVQVESAKSSYSRWSGLMDSISNQIQELISEESSLKHSSSSTDCVEHLNKKVASELEDEVSNSVNKVFDENSQRNVPIELSLISSTVSHENSLSWVPTQNLCPLPHPKVVALISPSDVELASKLVDAMPDRELFAKFNGPNRTIVSLFHAFGLYNCKWVDTGQVSVSLYQASKISHGVYNILGLSPFFCVWTGPKMFDKMTITCAPTEVRYSVSSASFSDDSKVPGLNEVTYRLYSRNRFGQPNLWHNRGEIELPWKLFDEIPCRNIVLRSVCDSRISEFNAALVCSNLALAGDSLLYSPLTLCIVLIEITWGNSWLANDLGLHICTWFDTGQVFWAYLIWFYGQNTLVVMLLLFSFSLHMIIDELYRFENDVMNLAERVAIMLKANDCGHHRPLLGYPNNLFEIAYYVSIIDFPFDPGACLLWLRNIANVCKMVTTASVGKNKQYANRLTNEMHLDKVLTVMEVSYAIGREARICSTFLNASVGSDGSCFWKDIFNLIYICECNGIPQHRLLHLPFDPGLLGLASLDFATMDFNISLLDSKRVLFSKKIDGILVYVLESPLPLPTFDSSSEIIIGVVEAAQGSIMFVFSFSPADVASLMKRGPIQSWGLAYVGTKIGQIYSTLTPFLKENVTRLVVVFIARFLDMTCICSCIGQFSHKMVLAVRFQNGSKWKELFTLLLHFVHFLKLLLSTFQKQMLEELATGNVGEMNMTKLVYYEAEKMNLDPLMTMVAVLELTMWVSLYKELTSRLVFLVAIPALACDPYLVMSLLIFPKGLGALEYFPQFTAAKFAGNMAVSDSNSFLEIMAIYVEWEPRDSRLCYGFPWQQFDKLWRDNGVSYLSRRTSLLEWKSENERTFLRPSLSKIFLTSYVVLEALKLAAIIALVVKTVAKVDLVMEKILGLLSIGEKDEHAKVFSQPVDFASIEVHIAAASLPMPSFADSNLEDKVLIKDGRNVMNVIKMVDPFRKMAIYIWDPGRIVYI